MIYFKRFDLIISKLFFKDINVDKMIQIVEVSDHVAVIVVALVIENLKDLLVIVEAVLTILTLGDALVVMKKKKENQWVEEVTGMNEAHLLVMVLNSNQEVCFYNLKGIK